MKSTNYYYSSTITNFLLQKNEEILGTIYSNDPHAETKLQQANTWETEIKILKQQLDGIKEGRILFEYTIPSFARIEAFNPEPSEMEALVRTGNILEVSASPSPTFQVYQIMS